MTGTAPCKIDRMRWLIVLAVACGHPQPPTPSAGSNTPSDASTIDAAPLDTDLPRLAQRAVELYKDVAAAFTAAGTDCGAATAKLRELTTKHAEVVAANAKVMRDGRGMKLKIALRSHEVEFDAAAKSIIGSPTLPACSQDETFAKAFDELVGAPP